MKKFLNLRGQAAVEFSLLLPIFALILFATIYIGMFVLDYVTLDNAAAKAARHAALNDYKMRDEDKTKIAGTYLFLSLYELKENECVKSWRGDIDSDGNFTVNNDSGKCMRVMIRATLKDDKKDTILGDILPEKYTISKIAEIPD